MKKDTLEISSLAKTWVLDLDGTIVKHNGYKMDGKDTLLVGVKAFFKNICEEDLIVFITARGIEFKEITEDFLKENEIPFDFIIYNAPYGERILINDKKPSGLKTAIAVNTNRDEFCKISFELNLDL